jgi:hypothetical protein
MRFHRGDRGARREPTGHVREMKALGRGASEIAKAAEIGPWMTKLEEAALTDRQGRASSARRSRAYEDNAKRTMEHALTATR